MPAPVFSIIIPTYNRLAQLLQCLDAINKLEYPKCNFEVIVIDDGGDLRDGIINNFKAISVTLFKIKKSGPAAARNYGAKNANGNFLVFTDDDCQPQKLWLASFENTIKDHPGVAFGGRTLNAFTSNIYSSASQLITDFLYDYLNDSELSFFTSNNFCIQKQDFFKLGGFDESFTLAAGEDRDFCERWKAIGKNLMYVYKAEVKHYHLLNIRSFWKQHFNYGRGAFQLRTYHKGKHRPLSRIKFTAELFQYPFAKLKFRKALSMVPVLILSQAAALTGYIFEKFKNKKSGT